jgi:hypothetical protein
MKLSVNRYVLLLMCAASACAHSPSRAPTGDPMPQTVFGCPALEEPFTMPPSKSGPPDDGLEDVVLEDAVFWSPPSIAPLDGLAYAPETDRLSLRFFAIYPGRANILLVGAKLTVDGKEQLELGFDRGSLAPMGTLARRVERGVLSNIVTSGAVKRGFTMVSGKITSLGLSIEASEGTDGQTLCLRRFSSIRR